MDELILNLPHPPHDIVEITPVGGDQHVQDAPRFRHIGGPADDDWHRLAAAADQRCFEIVEFPAGQALGEQLQALPAGDVFQRETVILFRDFQHLIELLAGLDDLQIGGQDDDQVGEVRHDLVDKRPVGLDLFVFFQKPDDQVFLLSLQNIDQQAFTRFCILLIIHTRPRCYLGYTSQFFALPRL